MKRVLIGQFQSGIRLVGVSHRTHNIQTMAEERELGFCFTFNLYKGSPMKTGVEL